MITPQILASMGLKVRSFQMISDSAIEGTKDVEIDAVNLARTFYLPFVQAGGHACYTYHTNRWQLTAPNNLQVYGQGLGLPFNLAIYETDKDLKPQFAGGLINYSNSYYTNNLSISPVNDIQRTIVIPLFRTDWGYTAPNWCRYKLTAPNNLQVIGYKYSTTSNVYGFFLIVEIP